MLGCREPKGGGEIGRREEVHPLTRQRGGERRGGHPLKRQRGTGKGETRQRAKEDARRTRKNSDQWEGREEGFLKKVPGEYGDRRGGNVG